MKPPQHHQEHERLLELRRYAILDTEREPDFDELVKLASELCDVPVSVINFVDTDRQWFKAEVGLGVRSTPLETSLCGHAILQGDFVEIPDTLADMRMADNPLCTDDGGFRFYAGAVLKGANGLPLGTLCVLDHRPRTLDATQRRVLEVLSRQVMRELELRVALRREKVLRREVDHRVKNSLASIGAMLSMKARRAPTQDVRTALEDASSRIRSLSSLHAELHDLEDGQTIELEALFKRVAADLAQLLPTGIALCVRAPRAQAEPRFANSLLLIVNEFVSNSVKHGRFDGDGRIDIVIDVSQRGWSLVCRDSGLAGPAAAERAGSGRGLGTQVIRSLAASLDAVPVWNADGGGMMLELAGAPN